MARVSERKDDSGSERVVRCKRRVRRSSRLDEDQATEPETCLPSNARLCPARLVARRRMQEYERAVIEVWNSVNREKLKRGVRCSLLRVSL